MTYFSSGFDSSLIALQDPGAVAPGRGRAEEFTRFAAALRGDLAPRNTLERILAERVILSAWTMQEIAENEFFTITGHAPVPSPRPSPRRGEGDRFFSPRRISVNATARLSPSPPRGEGARRADEGAGPASRIQKNRPVLAVALSEGSPEYKSNF